MKIFRPQTEFRFDYYRRAALNAGVPEMFADDAAQDIALRVWRSGRDDVIIVRRGAVDAARRYGERSRSGKDRKTVALENALHLHSPDSFHARERLLDLADTFSLLTQRQREAIVRAQRKSSKSSLA